ncbi:hypothetical protein Sango_0761500 [Sesamum angolense]|uniref:S-protein homolog n=1 Tax=Sesamum angolense TaxID=2727404 RepID=A0AAE1X251_9LAMI|nr:hypothetical protein Sango_0761500 [Sesamum angolense]
MSYTTIKNFFILFLLTSNLLQALSCHIVREYTIHVVNKLPPNSILSLHCASGDDDLGTHTVLVNGDYNWKLCDTWTGVTLFFCHLYWDSKQVAFDAFRSKWSDRCGLACYWEARSDGIYFSEKFPPEKLEKKHDWQNKKQAS